MFGRGHADDPVRALVERVHAGQVRRTCGACGAERWCPERPRITGRALDGSKLVYGRCEACGRGDLDRVVAGQVLGIDPDSDLLDGIRVTRYAALPDARPELPQEQPWAHVERRALAAQVSTQRRALDAVLTTPCVFCGDARLVEDFGRTEDGACDACEWHFSDRYFDTPDARRDHAAVWLATGTQMAGVGLGAQLGLRFWHELPEDERPQRATRPFSWITEAALVEWRERLGLVPPPPPPPSPPRPRHRARPRTITRRAHPAPASPPAEETVASSHRTSW